MSKFSAIITYILVKKKNLNFRYKKAMSGALK